MALSELVVVLAEELPVDVEIEDELVADVVVDVTLEVGLTSQVPFAFQDFPISSKK